jgi:hypothetical protein
MPVPVSRVREAVNAWAKGSVADDPKLKAEFVDFVYGRNRDDDELDTNLDTEWYEFNKTARGHWYTR